MRNFAVQGADESWVMQRRERVSELNGVRVEHWKTVSRPTTYRAAEQRLIARGCSQKLYRILAGPIDALKLNAVMEDAYL